MYVINLEMAHEGDAESSPHTPSPPHPAHLPAPDTTFQQQILQLKKQQELQQEILLQHFEQQRQQLAEQHEQQLRHHLKLWEQRKAIEEAAFREAREAQEAREVRERLERDRVEVLRKKDKHEHSANASMQVKQKLQEFLRNKIATNANGTVPASKWFSPNENYCHSSIHRGIVKSPSGESITSTGATATAHPYRLPPAFSAAAASDYPLRKTASEPNMLKVRIGKSRVFERRHAPLARRPKPRRRQDGGSPRGSPPGAPGGPGAAPPIREEEEAAAGGAELLFSSPSLPNISLGRPHAPPAHPAACPLPVLREAEGARGGKRPLGRTHSAPLPLGDAALQPPKAHVRDQIRKSVLTRAHDAAKQQLREEEGEVIDLTRRPLEPPASAPDPPAVPLARALSSPLVGARVPATGLAYDPIMLKHGCGCGANAPTHPEHGGRLQSVWARLHETGLAARTERTRPRRATLQELQSVHTEGHVLAFAGRREGGAAGVAAGGAGAGGARALVRLACGGLGVDADTAWSEAHTPPAARTAAGALLDLATRAALGHLANGFAVVRPPGHHAEPNQAMGFCFFNNVAIAARVLQTRLKLQRILIVDWDVHHGNGTQQIFYSDPGVLYMSIHRHDDGNFFPGTGAAGECGAGAGLGYSVNVPWSCGVDPPMADAEYLAAFRTIIMPIAREYNPEIVLVSCGFDAAAGHPPPLGGYRVSAACFAHMTQDLMTLANGKVVLSLEGGYDLPAMCDCAAECVKALLGARAAPPALAELARPPAPPAQAALRAVLRVQAQHWPRIKRYAELIGMSALEAGTAGGVGGVAGGAGGAGQSERDADTAAAMATLSMHHPRPHRSAENSRSVSEEPMEQDEGK